MPWGGDSITGVFAAYNEEKSVEAAMARALDALRDQFRQFEIVIVEDASRDRTPALCDALASAHPEIRVLHNETNLGQGASLVRGFRQARFDLVTHNAMDYPFDLRGLRLMTTLLAGADIAVAARRSRAGYSPYRVLTSAVHRALLQVIGRHDRGVRRARFLGVLRGQNCPAMLKITIWALPTSMKNRSPCGRSVTLAIS